MTTAARQQQPQQRSQNGDGGKACDGGSHRTATAAGRRRSQNGNGLKAATAFRQRFRRQNARITSANHPAQCMSATAFAHARQFFPAQRTNPESLSRQRIPGTSLLPRRTNLEPRMPRRPATSVSGKGMGGPGGRGRTPLQRGFPLSPDTQRAAWFDEHINDRVSPVPGTNVLSCCQRFFRRIRLPCTGSGGVRRSSVTNARRTVLWRGVVQTMATPRNRPCRKAARPTKTCQEARGPIQGPLRVMAWR